MSLINDALKKVEADKQNASAKVEGLNSPVEGVGNEHDRTRLFIIIFGGGTVLIAAAVMAVVYLVRPVHVTHVHSTISAPVVAQAASTEVAEKAHESQVAASVVHAEPAVVAVSEKASVEKVEGHSKQEIVDDSKHVAIEKKKDEAAAEKKDNAKQSLNEEMFNSFVGMLAPKKATAASESAAAEAPKVDYSIKHSDQLLEQVTKEAEQKKLREKTAVVAKDPAEIFVDAIRVTGVMFADSNSRVLMNNRVFSIDDMVNSNPKLILRSIEPHKLTFTDDTGRRYTKSF